MQQSVSVVFDVVIKCCSHCLSINSQIIILFSSKSHANKAKVSEYTNICQMTQLSCFYVMPLITVIKTFVVVVVVNEKHFV